jgi:outer membrane protein assembly factor BamB
MLCHAADDGYPYAFEMKKYKEQWRYRTDGAIGTSPTIANGVLIPASADGYVYAIGLGPYTTVRQ